MSQVIIAANFSADILKKIRAVSSKLQVEQISFSDRKWPADLITDAEIVYSRDAIPTPAQAPNLRWVQGHWAGVDSLFNSPIWDSNIIITSASGIHSTTIAQYTIAQMLHWSNRMANWVYYQSKSEWPENRWEKFVVNELRGSTLGILGYGSIGRELCRIAKTGFGMQVLATKRNAKRLDDDGYIIPGTGDPSGEIVDRIYPTTATRSMVAECDYVVVTLPLTSETEHFVNEDVLKAMKSSAYLINIGRGKVIHEGDLVKALKRGWIAGAGLDVFEQEPLPSDNPLWQLENVLLTPHVSGFTEEYDHRATDVFVENLHRYLAGEPLLNVVNRELGY